jgi:dolichol-phosphate mannosyltransferase
VTPAGAVWVILPTYDEAENLERAVTAVRHALRRVAPEGFRILVVDDASPDGTGVLADRLAASCPELAVLHRPCKQGLGPAYVAGFDHAIASGAGFVVEMDADLSHDPADLGRLLGAARTGADVVLGSRYVARGGVQNWPLRRRIVSRLGCWYARTVLGVPIRDLTGGFKCFRADALRDLGYREVRSCGYGFQIEVTWRALRLGRQVVEVPIVFRDREAGRSKMTWAIALEAARRVAALRWRAPSPRRLPAWIPAPATCLQFVRFVTVGATGYGVNVVTFALLVTTGLDYRVAALGAFLVAVGNNFVWNRRWTFRVRHGPRLRHAARFLAVSVAALGITVAVLSLLVGIAHLDKIPAEALAIVAAMPLSFLGNRLWTFRVWRKR